MTLLLGLVIVGLCMVITVLLGWLYTMRAVVVSMTKQSQRHTHCIDQVMWHVGGKFASLVLNSAADNWDKVDNMKHIDRLRREWKPGDQGVAAAWMREQAAEWEARDA